MGVDLHSRFVSPDSLKWKHPREASRGCSFKTSARCRPNFRGHLRNLRRGTRSAPRYLRESDLIKRWPHKSAGTRVDGPRSLACPANKEANVFVAGIDAHTR